MKLLMMFYAGSVMAHLTCTPTKYKLFFANSLYADFSETTL
jgi:hypothetical protein